jgi:hypothetical protein
MDKYKPEMSYGNNVAEEYDNESMRGDEEAAVAFLEQLAQGGRALELAVGTLGSAEGQYCRLPDREYYLSGIGGTRSHPDRQLPVHHGYVQLPVA